MTRFDFKNFVHFIKKKLSEIKIFCDGAGLQQFNIENH